MKLIIPILMVAMLAACSTAELKNEDRQLVENGKLVEITTENYQDSTNILFDLMTDVIFDVSVEYDLLINSVDGKYIDRKYVEGNQVVAVKPGKRLLFVECKVQTRDDGRRNEVVVEKNSVKKEITINAQIGFSYHLTMDDNYDGCEVKVQKKPSK